MNPARIAAQLEAARQRLIDRLAARLRRPRPDIEGDIDRMLADWAMQSRWVEHRRRELGLVYRMAVVIAGSAILSVLQDITTVVAAAVVTQEQTPPAYPQCVWRAISKVQSGRLILTTVHEDGINSPATYQVQQRHEIKAILRIDEQGNCERIEGQPLVACRRSLGGVCIEPITPNPGETP